MSDPSTAERRRPDQEHWWLCSHLVRLESAEPVGPAGTVLLEEISANGMRIAVEDPCSPGQYLRIQAEGFDERAEAIACCRRETDYLVELRFVDGFRWSPSSWQPQHLYRPGTRKAKARGASPNT